MLKLPLIRFPCPEAWAVRPRHPPACRISPCANVGSGGKMEPSFGKAVVDMDRWLMERPSLRVLGSIGGTGPKDGVLAHGAAEAAQAGEAGFPPESIFLCAPFGGGGLPWRNGCRLVAGGLEDLLFLERLAEQAGGESLFKVGLRLRAPDLPPDGTAILPDCLSDVAREIRRMRRLTVRGCFFSGSLTGVHGEALGRFFRAGYEAAKRMTVTLPCAMPYLCYENALAAIRENREDHPETLESCLRALDIVTLQNETAFYAKLYLS